MSEVVAAATPPVYVFSASDNPGALISSVILKEDNYPEWSTELRNSLQAKQKLGLIDGSVPKPAADPELSQWLAANSMIIGWIRTSIDPKIRSTVSFVTDASTLWKNLGDRFSVGNGVRKQVLKDEIASCKQEGRSVLEYYGRLTKLWEELQNYRTSRTCECAAAPDIAKEREEDRVHQFLFGLDLPRFSNIRSAITGEDPLPSLNQVYSRVIREEQNLNIARSKEVEQTDTMGFSVHAKASPHVAAVSGSRFRNRSTLSCTHCRRQGHEMTECFLIHGYPDWYYEQNRGGSKNADNRDTRTMVDPHTVQRGGRPLRGVGRGRGRANNARAASTSTTSNDQIAQLISLLHSQRPNTSSEKLSGPFFEDFDWSG
uniref:Retrotransposon Copia-like N-terminal domain-containing protein n=1 Tax=Noccaea caerulescens TaxID=107243 RepID=A0A1J3J8B5_NOCCA